MGSPNFRTGFWHIIKANNEHSTDKQLIETVEQACKKAELKNRDANIRFCNYTNEHILNYSINFEISYTCQGKTLNGNMEYNVEAGYHEYAGICIEHEQFELNYLKVSGLWNEELDVDYSDWEAAKAKYPRLCKGFEKAMMKAKADLYLELCNVFPTISYAGWTGGEVVSNKELLEEWEAAYCDEDYCEDEDLDICE